MKIKKEYIILAALIVALSLYLLLHKQDRTEYELPVLQGLPSARILKIEIAKPGEAILILEKKGDRWVISPDSHPADAGKVSAMLETIANLNVTALISESKSYERYGLGETDKIGVKAWTEQGLRRDFEVGKEAPSFQHTFVKIAGDERVFQARDNFRSRFDQTPDSLRDRTVLKFDLSEVESIEVRDAKKAVTFTRKPAPVEVKAGQETESQPKGREVVWESSEGNGDDAKLTQMLTALSALKCKGYIHDRKTGDFKDPVYSVRLKGAEVYTLSVFARDEKNKNDYPCVSSQSDTPFYLPEQQASRIMVSPDDMVKKAEKSP